MAEQVKLLNNFVGGLNTESNPLSFPENSSVDEDNFQLNVDGSRQRRLGIEQESGGTPLDLSITASEVSASKNQTFVWDNVDNSSTKSFLVSKIGTRLYFLNIYNEPLTTSFVGVWDGSTTKSYYQIEAQIVDEFIDFTSINGYLVVVYGKGDSFILEWDDANSYIKLNSTVEHTVRDVWGVFDDLETSERPSTLTGVHRYNLYNQGWTQLNLSKHSATYDVWAATTTYYPGDKVRPTTSYTGIYAECTLGSGSTAGERFSGAVEPTWGTVAGVTISDGDLEWVTRESSELPPSNAQIMWYGKDTNDNYSTAQLEKTEFGNSPAPKGKAIIRLFERGTDRNTFAEGQFGSDVLGIPVDRETGRFSCVSTFAGRVFWAGIESSVTSGDSESPKLTNHIFFSKLVSKITDVGKCYQESDPTAENDPELVDTDGGFLVIPEAIRIFKMVPLGESLYIFAENGIWELSGVDKGFVATDYKVSKVSALGAVGRMAIIEVEDTLVFWSKGGIYALQAGSTTERTAIESLSDEKVQSFVTGIDGVRKETMVSTYNPVTKVISWLYNADDTFDGIEDSTKYTKELRYDIRLKAFYIYTYEEDSTNNSSIIGIVTTPSYVLTNKPNYVYYDGELVVNGDDVVTYGNNIDVRGLGIARTKYITVRPSNSSMFVACELRNTGFLDWGVDNYSSYLVTGYDIAQDTMRYKQIPYITFHLTRTEDGFTDDGSGNLTATNQSSCLVTAYWDYSDHANSGKIGQQFEAYRLTRNYQPLDASDTFNYGQSVITTKNKLRGRGRAISLRIESSEGKDMKLLGWSFYMTGGSNV